MSKKRKSKMGRPPIPPEERRGVRFALRMTEAEWERIESEARKAGCSVGEYVRRRLSATGRSDSMLRLASRGKES